MSKHNSPFRYPGGKAKITEYLSSLIRNNNLRDCTYIEPYCGGAGAAINLLFSEVVSDIIINDLDYSIYSAWKCIVNHSEKFIEKLRKTPVSINEWKRQKKVFESDNSSLFNKGFATFYLNRTNRSGILTGGVIGGLDQDSKWKIDARFNKENLIQRIENIALYKDRITVTNKDGLELLKGLLKKSGEYEKFFYLDPPYIEKSTSLYYNSFKDEDHKRLANFIGKKFTNLNWMISYDKNETVEELYEKFRMEEFTLRYSAKKAKKGNELFIYSDLLENI